MAARTHTSFKVNKCTLRSVTLYLPNSRTGVAIYVIREPPFNVDFKIEWFHFYEKRGDSISFGLVTVRWYSQSSVNCTHLKHLRKISFKHNFNTKNVKMCSQLPKCKRGYLDFVRSVRLLGCNALWEYKIRLLLWRFRTQFVNKISETNDFLSQCVVSDMWHESYSETSL